jgi:hypothetical protein
MCGTERTAAHSRMTDYTKLLIAHSENIIWTLKLLPVEC